MKIKTIEPRITIAASSEEKKQERNVNFRKIMSFVKQQTILFGFLNLRNRFC